MATAPTPSALLHLRHAHQRSREALLPPGESAVRALAWLRRSVARREAAPLVAGQLSEMLGGGERGEVVRVVGRVFSDPDRLGLCFPAGPEALVSCDDDETNVLETTDVAGMRRDVAALLDAAGVEGPVFGALGHAFRSLTTSLMVSRDFSTPKGGFPSPHFRAVLVAWELAAARGQASRFDPVAALYPVARWSRDTRDAFVRFLWKHDDGTTRDTLAALQAALTLVIRRERVAFEFERALPLNLCLDSVWRHREELMGTRSNARRREREFVNEALSELCRDNAENEFLDAEFIRWHRSREEDLPPNSYFHMAFVLDTPSKEAGLHNFTFNQQQRESRSTAMAGLLNSLPVFVMHVRRDNLVGDTLAIMQQTTAEDWKKVLRVHFEGEEGVDAGGVRKEYFSLMMTQLLDPGFSMFVPPSHAPAATRVLWFNPDALESSNQFTLVGALMGLAIYNRVILALPFPGFLYSYLLLKELPRASTPDGLTWWLEDVMWWLDAVAQLDETLARTLRGMVTCASPEEFETAYVGVMFEVSRESWGEVRTVDLIPGGSSIPVTFDQRHAFVGLYCKWRLVDSCEAHLTAFKQGFESVMDMDILRQLWIRPDELELLVVGVETLDFQALEQGTRYDDGFDATSPTVRAFWKVLHGLDDEAKRRFLFFVTGSDRVPVRGLADLHMVISRNGPDSDQLPTSHTCFNHLLLPEYGDNDAKIREKLRVALDNAEGFGSR